MLHMESIPLALKILRKEDLVQGLCLDRQHDIQTLRKLFFSSEIFFKRGDGFLGCEAGAWNVREEF